MTSPWKICWASILCLLLTAHPIDAQHYTYEGQCELDLIFLIDSGVSTREQNFRTILNSIVDYSSKLQYVAPEAINVGIVAFSTFTYEFPLSGDLTAIKDQVPGLHYQGGYYSYTDKAFQMAGTLFDNNIRPSAPKVVVLITDGQAYYKQRAMDAAAALRNNGVTIWSIGWGKQPPYEELWTYAGTLDRISTTRDFPTMMDAVQLPSLACTAIYHPPSPTTSLVLETSSVVIIEASSRLNWNDGTSSKAVQRTSSIQATATSSTSASINTHWNSHVYSQSEANTPTEVQPTATQGIRVVGSSYHTYWKSTASSHVNVQTGVNPTPTPSTVAVESSSESIRQSQRNIHDKQVSGLTSTRLRSTQDVGHIESIISRGVSQTQMWQSTQTQPLSTMVSDESVSASHVVRVSSSIHVTPVTPLPSTTTPKNPPPIRAELLCTNAEKVDGLWLTSHPSDCDKFIQCHYWGEDQVTIAVRLCPRGLFWSQVKKHCIEPKQANCTMDPCRDGWLSTYSMDGGCGLYWRCYKGVSQGESCLKGYAYTSLEGCTQSSRCRSASLPQEPCMSKGICERQPVPGNRAYLTRLEAFPGEWMTMPCKYGAKFDMASCTCVASRPFAPDCKYIKKMAAYYSSSVNETHRVDHPASITFDPRSTRPMALRFQYKPSPPKHGQENQGEILMRSSNCPAGGLFVLWEEKGCLEARLFARNSYFIKASLPLAGLNSQDWRTVRVRYTFSGDLSLKVTSGHLTFTTYVEGGLYVPLSLCGWDAGLPGSLSEQVSPFSGEIKEIYISRCFDHGF